MSKSFPEFIRQKRFEYKKLAPAYCSELEGNYAYFCRDGFNHLIRKGRRLRKASDMIRRLRLIDKILPAVRAGKITKVTICPSESAFPVIFSLGYAVDGRRYEIILRMTKTGRFRFFSVY